MYLKPKTLVNLTALGSIPKPQAVPQTGSKKNVFTFTDDVAEEPKEQDQEHPVKESLNWLNPLNGVSVYRDWSCYQFISANGKRSAFDSSKVPKDKPFTDLTIEQGKRIRTIETLLYKKDGFLFGFRWFGDDGAVLLTVGRIDDYNMRNNPRYVVTSFTLNHNQRFVGIRSRSGGANRAWHYSVQWVICTEE